ncbi:MAG TPA: hypothetical protein VKL40_13335 [Candidatus Angelobacter sp.]|nr:hypothetical protein [Candidatus Angelobacter sp.]
MKATLLYRIAAVLLILFAAAHTFGFLSFTPPTPEGVAVRDAMNNVHFQVKNHSYSYGNFYRGFGLFATAYLLFAAFLAWHLGGMAGKHPQAIGTLAWGFFALQLVSLGLSWIYFAPPPAIASGLVAACAGWAASGLSKKKAAAVTPSPIASESLSPQQF